jgi:hypothetical protein
VADASLLEGVPVREVAGQPGAGRIEERRQLEGVVTTQSGAVRLPGADIPGVLVAIEAIATVETTNQ